MMFFSKNHRKQSDRACRFIAKLAQSFTAQEKGKGEGHLLTTLPPRNGTVIDQKADLSLDPPVLLRVMYTMYGWPVCCRSCNRYCGTALTSQGCFSRKFQPSKAYARPEKKTRVQTTALACMASDQVRLRSWCAKTIARGLPQGHGVLCPCDLPHRMSRDPTVYILIFILDWLPRIDFQCEIIRAKDFLDLLSEKKVLLYSVLSHCLHATLTCNNFYICHPQMKSYCVVQHFVSDLVRLKVKTVSFYVFVSIKFLRFS